MSMTIINRGRRTGKTLALINASYVTDYPIVVWDSNSKRNVKAFADKLGYHDIEVLTVEELRSKARQRDIREVFVDESPKMIEEALTLYLNAHPKAITMSVKCFDFPKDPGEATENEVRQQD